MKLIILFLFFCLVTKAEGFDKKQFNFRNSPGYKKIVVKLKNKRAKRKSRFKARKKKRRVNLKNKNKIKKLLSQVLEAKTRALKLGQKNKYTKIAQDLTGKFNKLVKSEMEAQIKKHKKKALKFKIENVAAESQLPVKVVNSQVSEIMHMAMDQANTDMYYLAAKLKDNLDRKNNVREDIKDFQDTIIDWPENAPDLKVEFTLTGADGKEVTKMLPREEAEAQLKELEAELSILNNMTQMMQLDLQQAQQRYSQAFQMLSNLMKSFHDTAKVMIQNIR
ncbi:hypothetical protein ACFL35_18915 [Candidatus Riflebacteria bacterium]